MGALDFAGRGVDPYLNETTRHADVILPPPANARTAHFDVALCRIPCCNNARPPAGVPVAARRPDEAEIHVPLSLVVLGLGAVRRPLVDDQVISAVLAKEVADPSSPVSGRSVADLPRCSSDGPGYRAAAGHDAAARPVRRRLRVSRRRPDAFAESSPPHGIDLGPWCPRIRILRTRSGRSNWRRSPF